MVLARAVVLAVASAAVFSADGAWASEGDLHWDGRQLVSPEGGFSIRPKGRILLDAASTDGSRFPARDVSGDEIRALRLGVEGTVGKHLFYTAEGDFAGDEPILRSTYLAWRDRWNDHDVEFTLGNRLSERGLDGSSSSDGTPFLERNSVALAISPLKGFYGWGGIAKVYGGDWHVAMQVAGDDPGNPGVARDTTSYLARAHWNPVKSKAGAAHVGLWGFYEDYPSDLATHAKNTAWAGHINSAVMVPLGTLRDPQDGGGYGVEVGGSRGPLWSYLEAGRREVRTANDDVHADAVSFSAGWMITGEAPAYATRSGTFVKISPRAPLSKGGPGGWEVAIRYQTLDNTDAPLGGRGREAELGVNWRMEDRMRLMVNLTHWEVRHRAGAYVGDDSGDTLAGRLQINF